MRMELGRAGFIFEKCMYYVFHFDMQAIVFMAGFLHFRSPFVTPLLPRVHQMIPTSTAIQNRMAVKQRPYERNIF